MMALPGDLVTFLLTDIEGSTALWEDAPDTMRAALAQHDTLFEQVISEHSGAPIRPRGEGDSRFAVFGSVPNAALAALALQRTFASAAWPTPKPIAVRIGLHTGEADLREGDYYGSAVNRCARLRSIGHGGQTLLSEATAALVRDCPPPGSSLLDRGEHRLKDLTRPERVFQLVADGLRKEFPPLQSLDARPNNLPVQPTTLLGRERAVDDVRRLVLRDDTRLVTLTGPGGTGKTRLSLQVAAELVDQFVDGAYFVDLSPIGDPTLVPATVAQTLGVRDIGGRPILEALKEHLRRRSLLLVLDNFEQILPAAPMVAELLASSSGLQVLVTSREPLHLRGEYEYAVPPLALPVAGDLSSPNDLARYGAVALFVERAVAIRSDFAVTAENAPAVAQICARLDGLPLAIELAAARVRLLSPQAMLARLERRLPLLTQGSQDLPARQRTLRDAIAWSYDLLTPAEQELFRRLAIFVGGCTIESADAVDQADIGERLWHLDAGDVLDGIDSLLAKSLLRRLPGPDDAVRVTMLETVREFGLERLQAAGELHALRRWHAGHFLDLAEQAVPLLRGPEQTVWLDRLEAEHANLRAALEWSLTEDRQTNAALRLSAALAWFWATRGHASEGHRWLARALAGPDEHPKARLGALYGAGWLAHISSDAPASQAYLEAALPLAQQQHDRWAMAWVVHLMGRVAYYQNDATTARQLGEQSLGLSRELGDEWLAGWALQLLGVTAHIAGDLEMARRHHEQALEIRRRLVYPEGLGMCAFLLGLVDYHRGEYASAYALTREGLQRFDDVGVKWVILNALGSTAALIARHQPETAVRLAGAIDAIGTAINIPPIPLVADTLTGMLEQLHTALSGAAFEAAWSSGQAMSLEEAVAVALAVEPPPDTSDQVKATPTRPAGALAGLSPREIEVLRLLAAGHTNDEIADLLVLSLRTVERHVTHVYEKIGARNRAEATAFALRHGLADGSYST